MWGSTTMLLVEASGGGKTSLGYTHGDISPGRFTKSNLKIVILVGLLEVIPLLLYHRCVSWPGKAQGAQPGALRPLCKGSPQALVPEAA